jgi:tRNA C32,U32 (ribose-2'-O)-methylase TrmJ
VVPAPSSVRPSHQAWPRALKASLTALPTVAFNRAPAAAVTARPSRFPFDGTFTLRPPGKRGAPPPPPPARTLSAADVLSLLGDSSLVDAARVERMRAVAAARTWAVLPVVESNHDRGNLGAVARTADALGFGGLWVASPSTERYRPTRGRCAAGAEKWLDARVFASKSECVAALKAHGYVVAVAVGAGPGVLPVADWDWAGTPTAIVLGNEGDGVSPETQAAADVRLTIPMAGFVESFNVSVAAALILQTARRALDEAAAASAGGGGRLLSPGEAEALTAGMLLRHKGSAWSAPVLEAMLERAGRVGAGVV